MREAMVWLIESVGLTALPFETADAFLSDGRHICVGVIITDMRMPGTSGLGLLETLRERGCMLPVIVVSAFANVHDAVRAMRLGAVDLMEKPFNEQDLLDRVQACLGQTRARAAECCATNAARLKLARLTDREQEVMALMAQGARSKDIARSLDLSVKTVDIHRHNVLSKLEATSTVDVHRTKARAEMSAQDCPCRTSLPGQP
ncbi:MAG: transcriptional regulator [Rhodospirillaceae bacterium BRH_c57]|nr:MAG: transcriptional regulator [Rhodospirillaceae bacterium BRH_c57]